MGVFDAKILLQSIDIKSSMYSNDNVPKCIHVFSKKMYPNCSLPNVK